MAAGPVSPISVEQVLRFVDELRGEAMELVETAPAHMRSEFGFGTTHGWLQAANRLKELVDNHLAEAERKEEAFEKEF